MTPRHLLVAAASLLTLTVSLPTSAIAQKIGDRVRVRAGSAMRQVPGGQVMGVISREYEGKVESAQGDAVRIRLVGFISADELRMQGDQQRALVGGTSGAILRAGPSATDATLAELRRGETVFPSSRSGAFVEINRAVWIDKTRLIKGSAGAPRAVTGSAPGAATDTKPATPAPLPRSVPVAADAPPLETTGPSTLKNAPDGDLLATIPGGVIVTPLAKENGWVRVRMEGWLPDKEVGIAGAKAAGAVTAADLRADGEAAKGRMVRWSVEAISYQVADAVRREMTVGEPYLLARGPGNERAILYLAIPDSLVTAAKALPPMAEITITARVRSGRSQPAGIPILELLQLSRK